MNTNTTDDTDEDQLFPNMTMGDDSVSSSTPNFDSTDDGDYSSGTDMTDTSVLSQIN